jgi:O-succinylbenzoic acid--CoA ligase
MIVVDFSSPDFDVQHWLSTHGTGDVLEDQGRAIIREWLEADEVISFQTSGSTGEPKPIEYPKSWVKTSVSKTILYFNLQKGNTVLHCLPPSFVAGKMMWLRAYLEKWKLLLVEPKAQLEIPSEVIDFAAFTPLQFDHLLNVSPSSLEKIKTSIIGGGAVGQELLRKIKLLDANIYATFGMTETLTHIAVSRLLEMGDQIIFTPFDGVEVDVDQRQCLSLKIEYFDNLQLQTNDMVELHDSRRFSFIGRADRIINSGGKKINPEVLEARLEKVLDRPFYFCALKSEQLGEALALMIEGEDENFNSESWFMNWDKLERPKFIFYRKKFMYTNSGKVIKKYFE